MLTAHTWSFWGPALEGFNRRVENIAMTRTVGSVWTRRKGSSVKCAHRLTTIPFGNSGRKLAFYPTHTKRFFVAIPIT